MTLKTIYAGCDVDERVHLYFDDGLGNPEAVRLSDWLEILSQCGAKPGEMLVVTLNRDPQ